MTSEADQKQQQQPQDQPKKEKKKYLARYSDDNTLAESIIIGRKARYAVVDKSDNEAVRLLDSVNGYYPPKSDLGLSYLFKNEKQFDETLEAAKHENLDTLYGKVLEQWKKYSCAGDHENELCAADTIYTYYQDVFGMTHYLFFIGSPDSGKSNRLYVLHILGYRNLISTDMTAANVYRHLGSEQEFQGTICEDEADDLDEDREKMRIYKNGYIIGFRVRRNDKEGSGRLSGKAYNTFSFKAFAAERSPDSTSAKGFNTRIVPIKCIADIPQWDISEVISPGGDEEFASLRNELFELRNLIFCHKLLHCHDRIPNIKLNISNREKQLFKPLIRLFQGTKTQSKLLPVISHFVNERRNTNLETLLSLLYTVVNDLVAHRTIIESGEIWRAVKDSIPAGSDVPYRPLSYETAEFGTISEKGVIEMVKDNFKAKPPKHRGSKRELEFNKEILERLRPKYTPETVEVKEVVEAKKNESDSKSETDETDETHSRGKDEREKTHNSSVDDSVVSPKDPSQASHASQNSEFERVLDRLKGRRIKEDTSQHTSQTEVDDGDGGRSKRVSERYNNHDDGKDE